MNPPLAIELSAFDLERIAELIRYFEAANPDLPPMSPIQVLRFALDEFYHSRIGKLVALTLEDCIAVYESMPTNKACPLCEGTGVRVAGSPCRNCYGTGVVVTEAQAACLLEEAALNAPGNGQGQRARRAPQRAGESPGSTSL